MSEKKIRIMKLGDYEFGDTIKILPGARIKSAKNKRTNEFILLKIIKKKQIIDSKQADHVANEIKILSTLSHPNIINFTDFFQDEKCIYMAFEFINGGDLFSLLRAKISFSPEIASFYLGQIIFALEYLHSKNIIYRNLKPENLLIKSNGYLKLIGFELVKNIEGGRTYTMCGTPEYLAPEIILNKGYGKPVDWWALGVLLYEMIAGIDPFSDDDPMNVYENILNRKLEFSSAFNQESKSLIKHLLEPDLSKRYGNLLNGVNDIKNHAFFKTFNWEKLMTEETQATYVPRINGEGDISNFNFYPDSKEDTPKVLEGDPFINWDYVKSFK